MSMNTINIDVYNLTRPIYYKNVIQDNHQGQLMVLAMMISKPQKKLFQKCK